MEIKANKNFTDRKTGKEYEKGKTYKIDKERAAEILKSPYNVAEEVKRVKEDKEDVQTKTN